MPFDRVQRGHSPEPVEGAYDLKRQEGTENTAPTKSPTVEGG